MRDRRRRIGGPWVALAAALLGAVGCGSGESSAGSHAHAGTGAPSTGAGSSDPPPPDTVAVLAIHPLDIWAQPLPADEATLTVTRDDGSPVAVDGFDPALVYLTGPASYAIHLSAPQHVALDDLVVQFDGSDSPSAVRLSSAAPPNGQGISLSHAVKQFATVDLPSHDLYLGLRHRWFSAEGRPARRGNLVEFYMDGEQAWGAAHTDLAAAKSSILASTWWWESNFEIVRDPATTMTLSPSERWKNTMLGTIEATPAYIRVLVNQFLGQDGLFSWVNVDDPLLAYADATGDGFEFMGDANQTSGRFLFEIPSFDYRDRVEAADPTAGAASFDPEQPIASTVPTHEVDLTKWPVSVDVEIASYHQKFLVVDSDVAFVGGMNVKGTDWDTSEHRVFEPRRMSFDATYEDRQAVLDKEAMPDNGPRKDYMVRIEGPAAQDVADVFHRRWAQQLADGVAYADKSSDFDVARDIAPRAAGKQIQVTATLPEPFWEHAIAETWFNAVNNAEQFIYIEDQYFRIPLLNEAIRKRMEEQPALRLIVITKPIDEWTDPGCPETYAANQVFESEFPDRYMLLQLRAFDTQVTWGWDETESRFVDMDTHSKMLMVDDTFMSVGSCNKNNRGIIYEGELNVAIVDPDMVRAVRRKILQNILPDGTAPTDSVDAWWTELADAAAYNDWVHANWDAEGGDIHLAGTPLPSEYEPRGLVYGLSFGPVSDCLIESVGPDMTAKPAAPTE